MNPAEDHKVGRNKIVLAMPLKGRQIFTEDHKGRRAAEPQPNRGGTPRALVKVGV
jgi:hypothetical protein